MIYSLVECRERHDNIAIHSRKSQSMRERPYGNGTKTKDANV